MVTFMSEEVEMPVLGVRHQSEITQPPRLALPKAIGFFLWVTYAPSHAAV